MKDSSNISRNLNRNAIDRYQTTKSLAKLSMSKRYSS